MAGDPSVLKGTVRDGAGNPVAGARVFFTGGPAPLPDIAALTDAEGGFTLSAPKPGTYELECHSDASGSATMSVTLPTRGEGEITIHLR